MPESSDPPKDWKLRLRYGRLETPYHHYTTVSDGAFAEPSREYGCSAGPAVMTMRVWASDPDEATRMASILGGEIGFSLSGRVEVYDTLPEEPPRENPFGYDSRGTPHNKRLQLTRKSVLQLIHGTV